MTVFNFPDSDLQLWREYAAFHVSYCSGFWSPGQVMRPYGLLQFGEKGDWGDSLWRVKSSAAWNVDDIIADVESLSARNLNKAHFYFNASYDKDTALQLYDALPSYGYTKKYEVNWLVMDNLPDLSPVIPAGYTLQDATDPASFIKVHNEAFPDHDVTAFYQRQIPHPRSNSNIRLFILSDPAGEPVAIGGIAWDGDFGNLFSLGVRPDWRRQGLGKLMIDWRLKLLSEAGVKYIVTGVLATNDASYALQTQKGYRPFARAEAWLKD